MYVDICIHEIIQVTIKASHYKTNKLREFGYTYPIVQIVFSN